MNDKIKKTNEIDRQNEKLEEQGKIQDENKKKAEELKQKMTAIGKRLRLV